MGCLEGASRTPGRRSAKNWEGIKIAIDNTLGRSIFPSREVERMHRAPLRVLERRSKAHGWAGSVLQQRVSSRGLLLNQFFIRATPEARTLNLRQLSSGGSITQNTPTALAPPMLHRDNALAGALAGTFVSLCLHPVDTVKTVLQAQCCGSRSIVHTLLRIVSDRGVLGLYRGLGSNLTSSAPISAIYAFTYESVKAALVPNIPKEYHSLAHCTAGGCASFATSFVYTPSECIKQRMQVGSLYRNSWLAFWNILQNGGLLVLYAGWRAVLWRNVPQSVIKFYTYEGLKHSALDGYPAGTTLGTFQTLVFGGLAGSTAAVFTTPFDVIKTRLQTQSSSTSFCYQKGVLGAFSHIASSEGVGGLYRGLIPRLMIYAFQGALFFASYELFKRILSTEIKRRSVLNHEENTSIASKQPLIAISA